MRKGDCDGAQDGDVSQDNPTVDADTQKHLTLTSAEVTESIRLILMEIGDLTGA